MKERGRTKTDGLHHLPFYLMFNVDDAIESNETILDSNFFEFTSEFVEQGLRKSFGMAEVLFDSITIDSIRAELFDKQVFSFGSLVYSYAANEGEELAQSTYDFALYPLVIDIDHSHTLRGKYNAELSSFEY